MSNILGSGFDIYQILWFFIIYAFLGWCVEVCFVSIRTRKFVNRGFLNGPVCPIYGFGVIAVILLLHPFINNIVLLFAGSVIVTSLLELVTGFLLQILFHTKWWDYSTQRFNIGGYICLRFSLLWGVGCLFLLKVVHPLISASVQFIPYAFGVVLLIFIYALLLADVIVTVIAVTKLNHDLGSITELAKNLHKGSDVLAENLGNRAISVAEKVEELDWEEQKQKISTQLDEGKERVRDALDIRRDKFNARIEEISQKSTHIQRRLLSAFPNMQSIRNKTALEELKKHLFIDKKPAKPSQPKEPETKAQKKQN